MARKTLGDLGPKTDEAQWGVNAFVLVSCGFSLLLSHIFAAVKDKMYQWIDVAQSAGREQLHDQLTTQNSAQIKKLVIK